MENGDLNKNWPQGKNQTSPQTSGEMIREIHNSTRTLIQFWGVL